MSFQVNTPRSGFVQVGHHRKLAVKDKSNEQREREEQESVLTIARYTSES